LRRPPFARSITAALAWGLLAACSGDGGSGALRNVLLISIDTCRADRIGCYRTDGSLAGATPNIDRIAREGVRFENATSPVPLTLPAHASMLTGTIPPYHGVHDNGEVLSDPANLTLPEILGAEGFATAGVIGSLVLSPRFGIDQGFDHYNPRPEPRSDSDQILERRADDVTRFAVEWLDARDAPDEPFFLFVHYYDPHQVFDPPEPFRSRFADDAYQGEIAFVDHAIGELLGRLDELGLAESTLVVITADHGEMLGEHGELAHGFFIYESAMRVPLIVKIPGGPAGAVIGAPAGLVDLVPTVCGLLGIEAPDGLDGVDLAPLIRGYPNVAAEPRSLYGEATEPTKYGCNPLLSVRDGRFKYIDTTRPELYDVESDPGERANLLERDAATAQRLSAQLDARLAERSRVPATDPDAQVGSDALERLRSLGYVAAGGATDALTIDPARDDPKDWIAFHALNGSVPHLLWFRLYDEARRAAEELVRQQPDYYSGHVYLGELALVDGAPDAAVDHFRRAAELQAEASGIRFKLGKALLAASRPAEAIESFGRALELDERNVAARSELALALTTARRYDEAIVQYRRLIEIDPGHVAAHTNLADLLVPQGKVDEALELYRRAVALSDRAEVHKRMAVLLARVGRRDEAVEAFRRAVEAQPDSVELQATFAAMLLSLDRKEEALPHFRRVVELEPQSAARRNNLGSVLQMTGRSAEAIEHFRRAVELDPDNVGARFNLGQSLGLEGRFAEAAVHLRRAIELSPDGHPQAERLLQQALAASAGPPAD
jgi:arylsulfatase A-like enzyme/Flp pilus assembly protein TadD